MPRQPEGEILQLADAVAQLGRATAHLTQVDGVVWSQVIVDQTVYVAGKFTSARPAGAGILRREEPHSCGSPHGPWPG